MKRSKNPLYVYVDDNEYVSHGKPTLKNRWLGIMLDRLGGVNESVAPGMYVFSVYLTLRGWMVSLLPAEE